MSRYQQVLDFDTLCPECNEPMVWIRPEHYNPEDEALPKFHICISRSHGSLLLQDGVGKIRSFSRAIFPGAKYCDCGKRIQEGEDCCDHCKFAKEIHQQVEVIT